MSIRKNHRYDYDINYKNFPIYNSGNNDNDFYYTDDDNKNSSNDNENQEQQVQSHQHQHRNRRPLLIRGTRRIVSSSSSSKIQQVKQQQQLEQKILAQKRNYDAYKNDPTLFVGTRTTSSSNTQTYDDTKHSNKNIRSNPTTTTNTNTTTHDSHVLYNDDHLNDTTFHTIQPRISSNTIRSIQDILYYQQMTQIQYKTYPIIRRNDDNDDGGSSTSSSSSSSSSSILARSRTGSGKTIAYLVPAIERIVHMDSKAFRPGRMVGILIICPTRELVMQIAQLANTLLTYHKDCYTVLSLYGGGSIQRDKAILLHRPIPTIIVSTPGRLYDLINDAAQYRVYGNRKLTDVLQQETQIVVMDEVDRLVEGFMKEMYTILSHLPRVEKRQTLLFSATISNTLRNVLQQSQSSGNTFKLLPTNYSIVDCIDNRDRTTQTNQRVVQSFVQLVDMKLYVSAFLSIVDQLMIQKEHPTTNNTNGTNKVIIFLPTAKLVKFFTEALLSQQSQSDPTSMLYDIYTIHSRMSQGSRNRASTLFRTANSKRSCILLSSDVSARGMDYPDVTFVVQYGAPYNDDLYLHRLGRTGRAGQGGNGLLVLLPFETYFRSRCRKFNIIECTDEVFSGVNDPSSNILANAMSIQRLVQGGHSTLSLCAETAYLSFIAHYVEYGRMNDRNGNNNIINSANLLADSLGLVNLPAIPQDIQKKLTNCKLKR